jgi:hypothetical protein
MLAYNIWRYLKMLAKHSAESQQPACKSATVHNLDGIMINTLRIARLRLLLIVAKVVTASNRDKVRYSVQDNRTPALMSFLQFLDLKRSQTKPWSADMFAGATM